MAFKSYDATLKVTKFNINAYKNMKLNLKKSTTYKISQIAGFDKCYVNYKIFVCDLLLAYHAYDNCVKSHHDIII